MDLPMRPISRQASALIVASTALTIAIVTFLATTIAHSTRQDVGLTKVAGKYQDTTSDQPRFSRWVEVEDFPTGIAQFKTVFWEPADTESLRVMIRETDLVSGQRVLEIGTGTGLVALCCLANGAESVVATDINPHAVANARYNANRFPITSSLDVRLVSENDPGAFAVIGEGERFDLIISNPPWEDGKPAIVDEYALYDPEFALLESLLAGLDRHLNDNGRVLLAYGCVEAIRVIQKRAPTYGWEVVLLDDRDLDSLPNLFLPGMLLELKRLPTKD